MKRTLMLVLLVGCGRGAPTQPRETKPGEPSSTRSEWEGQALVGCADFFVAFRSNDRRQVLTLRADRQKLGLSAGTHELDPSNVDAAFDVFSAPLTNSYYCDDIITGVTPASSRSVTVGRLQVTLEKVPPRGESYPIEVELDDVDLGGGVTAQGLSGRFTVGWFAG